jgi:hypothetical protein
MKYRVSGVITLGIDMRVEADSAEKAIEKAYLEWPGLTNYCGNGKVGGGLCGPYQNECDANVDAGYNEDPQFTIAEPEED